MLLKVGPYPFLLRKHTATCGFPGGPDLVSPLDPRMQSFFDTIWHTFSDLFGGLDRVTLRRIQMHYRFG